MFIILAELGPTFKLQQSSLRTNLRYTQQLLTRKGLSFKNIIQSKQKFCSLHTQESRVMSTFGTWLEAEEKPKRAAVVGAGIAGLACAQALAKNGFQVNVFEQGRGVGGRMSTRRDQLQDGGQVFFDHGAQHFTASDPKFKRLVATWLQEGVIKEWQGVFGVLDTETGLTVEESARKRYVGVPAMNTLCKHLATTKGVTVHTQSKITGLYRVDIDKSELGMKRNSNSIGEEPPKKWRLDTKSAIDLEDFDVVVVADKNFANLQSSDPSENSSCMEAAGLKDQGLQLQTSGKNPSFALMVAFESNIAIPYNMVTLLDHPMIKSVSRNSSKPGREQHCDQWVILSSVEYAERKIGGKLTTVGSSEHNQLLDGVRDELFQAFQNIVTDTLALQMPTPVYKKAHRWGAAFPETAVGGGLNYCFSEPKRFLACGDFCVKPKEEPHGYIEVAVLSGLAAADKAGSFFDFSGKRSAL